MPISLKGTLLFFCLSLAHLLHGQSGNNSPYSRFGLGDLHDGNLMAIRQMGGLSASFADAYQINVANPASYSFLRSTSFDLGVSMTNKQLSTEDQNTSLWSGNLDYIALAFPLRNPLNEAFEREKKPWRMGMGFALLPVSEVAYDISNQINDPVFGEIERNFTGSGGTWKALFGNSFQYNNLSVGLHLGYMFGNIQYERNLTFVDRTEAFDNSFDVNYNLDGFVWNGGLMYQLSLNEEEVKRKSTTPPKELILGLTFGSATNFSTKADLFERSTLADAFQDTLSFEQDVLGSGRLPAQIGVGATYYNGNSYSLGVNYELVSWSQYRNDANPESLSDSHRLSFGGYYRPNYKSFNFRDRIYYRFGVQYHQEPISIDGDQLDNLSLSLGVGLPFIYQRKVSHMNLGVHLGTRGSIEVLRERYIKIGVSFTFNDDEWFIRRQYN